MSGRGKLKLGGAGKGGNWRARETERGGERVGVEFEGKQGSREGRSKRRAVVKT